MVCPAINANVFTGSCARKCAVAWRNLLYRHRNAHFIQAVAVKESNQRWCSIGFEFCCDNGRLRVTFALDCCDRIGGLHWAVTTGGFNSETVQDVMLGAVERRFGN